MTDAPAASERLLTIFTQIETEIAVSGGLTVRRIDDLTLHAEVPPPNGLRVFLQDDEVVVHVFCDDLFDIRVTWGDRDLWNALCRFIGPMSPKSGIQRCIRAFGIDPQVERRHPLTDLKASSLIISLARAVRSG